MIRQQIDKSQHNQKNIEITTTLFDWKKNIDQLNLAQEQSNERIVVLANGEGIFEKEATKKKIESNRISCKMIGLSSSTKNLAEFVESPYLLDKYSCAYLIKNQIIEIRESICNKAGIELIKNIDKDPIYVAYRYLITEKNLFLVDGHKFGCCFLAYNEHPDTMHAIYLVFVLTGNQPIQFDEISRLAGICKKKALLIRVWLNGQQTKIEQEQILPRGGQQRRVQKQVSKTQQLLLLKKMIGYNY